jgi:hypothetical protein
MDIAHIVPQRIANPSSHERGEVLKNRKKVGTKKEFNQKLFAIKWNLMKYSAKLLDFKRRQDPLDN